MFIGLALMIILAICLKSCVKLIKNRDLLFADSLPLSCMVIIMNMYLLSIVGLTGYSQYIVLSEIAVFFIIILLYWIKRNNQYNKVLHQIFCITRIELPQVFSFLLLVLLVYYTNSRAKLFQWDEFSHWGLTVKDMYYSKRLSIYHDSATWFKSYPPGMALWQYFFVSWSPVWDDSIVVWSYNIFIIVMLMPIFRRIIWKYSKNDKEIKNQHNIRNVVEKGVHVLGFFILCFVTFCIPYLYYSPYEATAWRCICIDRALSLTLAYILVSFFTCDSNMLERKKSFVWVRISLAASILCLLKPSGIVLALLGYIIISVKITIESGWKSLKRLFLPILFMALTFFSWRGVLSIYQVGNTWNLDLSHISSLLNGTEEAWRYDIINGFIPKLYNTSLLYPSGSINISILGMPVIWGAGIFLICCLEESVKDSFKKWLPVFLSIVLCFIIYEISVLFTELYLLSQAEGMIYASLARYSSNFCLGITIFIVVIFVDKLLKNRDKRIYQTRTGILLLLVFVLSAVPIQKVYKDISNPKEAIEESYRTTGFINFADNEEKFGEILTNEDKVFILSIDDSFGYYVLAKQLVPAKCNLFAFDSTVESNIIETGLIPKIINEGYNYIFVNKLSDAFITQNKDLFINEIKEGMLYKIEKTENGDLEIKNVFEERI